MPQPFSRGTSMAMMRIISGHCALLHPVCRRVSTPLTHAFLNRPFLTDFKKYSPPSRERNFGALDQKFTNPRKYANTHRIGTNGMSPRDMPILYAWGQKGGRRDMPVLCLRSCQAARCTLFFPLPAASCWCHATPGPLCFMEKESTICPLSACLHVPHTVVTSSRCLSDPMRSALSHDQAFSDGTWGRGLSGSNAGLWSTDAGWGGATHRS